MSALDQKRTLCGVKPMSALPPKRTLIERVGMSALCQKRTHAPQQNTDRLGRNRADEIGLTLVFNEGVRAIATAGTFCVPLALLILVLNGFRIAVCGR